MEKIIPIIFILLLMCACSSSKVDNDSSGGSESPPIITQNEEIKTPTPTTVLNTPIQEINNSINANKDETKKAIKELSDKIVNFLDKKDMIKLSNCIHPSKGVRFSQYGRVHIKEHKNFKAEQVKVLLNDTKKYVWGAYEGSGDNIELTPKEYLEKFVFNKSYETAKFAYNEKLSQSGYSDDFQEAVYPNSIMSEYYFKGKDPDVGGLDWTSLRFIFELYKDNWYLVGIISNQQTF